MLNLLFEMGISIKILFSHDTLILKLRDILVHSGVMQSTVDRNYKSFIL